MIPAKMIPWLLVLALGASTGYLLYHSGEQAATPCPVGTKTVVTKQVPGPDGQISVVQTEETVYTGTGTTRRDEYSLGLRISGTRPDQRVYSMDVGMQLGDLPAELTVGADWRPSTGVVSPTLGLRVSF